MNWFVFIKKFFLSRVLPAVLTCLFLIVLTRLAGASYLPTVGSNIGIGTSTPVGALTIMNGNVGIGTWSPIQRLQVAGTVAATTFIGDGSGLTNLPSSSGWTDGGTNVYPTTTSDAIGIGTTTPGATLEVVKQSAGVPLTISSSPTNHGDYLVVNANGNIGIGTTSPRYHFSVIEPGNAEDASTVITGSNQLGSTISVQGNGQAYFLGRDITNNTEFVFGASTTNNAFLGATTVANLDFRTNNIDRMRLTEVGNFGVGTTTALSKMVINGGVGIGTISSSNFINNAAPNGGLLVENNVGIGTTTPVGALTVMNGNVGFGTYSPTANLSIKSSGRGAYVDLVNTNGTKIFDLGTDSSGSGYPFLRLLNTDGSVAFSSFGDGNVHSHLYINASDFNMPDGSTSMYGNAISIRVPYVLNQENGIFFYNSSSASDVSGGAITFYTSDAGNTGRGGLKFKTSSAGSLATRMIIDPSGNIGMGTSTPVGALTVMNGNVGIGTWSPTQRLQVIGTVTATAFSGDGSALTNLPSGNSGWTDGGTNVYTSTTTDNVGIGTTTPNSATLEIVKNAAQPLLKLSSSATSAGNFLLVDSAGNIGIGTTKSTTSALSIMNGNVGIGTWSPSSNLEIRSETASVTLVTETDSQYAVTLQNLHYFLNPVNIVGYQGANILSTYDGNGQLGLYSNRDERMRLDLNGNVGIGTTTPNSLLTVKGNASIGSAQAYTTLSAPANGLMVQGNVGIGTFDVTNGSLLVSSGNVGIGTLKPVNGTAIMNGNVGIGTWSPTARLQVVGTVNATAFVGDGSGLTGVSTNSGWTDGGSNVYTSTTTDKVGIGTTTPSTSLEIVQQGSLVPLMVSSTATGDGNYLIIDSGGNVGIGTTNPQGIFNVQGGTAAATTDGVPINLVAQTAGSGGNNNGGGINITSGNSTGSGLAGSITLTTPLSTSATYGSGDITLNATGYGGAGHGAFMQAQGTNISGNGGDLVMRAGNGVPAFGTPGNVSISGGNAAFNTGGTVTITGGTGGATTGVGGDLYLSGGEKQGAGTMGNIFLASSGGNIGVGTIDPRGGLTIMNGNVGVGTWSPTQGLQVVGTVAATAFVGDGSGLTGISAGSTGWTDGGTNVYTSTTTDNVGIGTTTPTAALLVQNASAIDSLRVNDVAADGTPFIIDANGNVGIGTTTTDMNLTIYEAFNPGLKIDNGGLNSILFTNGSGGNEIQSNGDGGATLSDLLLIVGSSSAGNPERMRIVAASGSVGIGTANPVNGTAIMNGNVGIGTWSPTARLQVVGTVSATSFAGDGSGLTGISAGGWTDGGTNVYTSTTTDMVAIGTTTPVSRLTIKGNAGIGTTTPYTTIAAPANGMVVEGNVGIGTWASDNGKLIVMGGNIGVGTALPNAVFNLMAPSSISGNAVNAITAVGGAGAAANGNGGGFSFTGGASAGTGTGGGFTIVGGSGGASGPGGAVSITSGSSSSASHAAGNVTISSGDSGNFAPAGSVVLRGGTFASGGAPSITLGGSGSVHTGGITIATSDGNGIVGGTGAISIATGNAATGMASDGGNISITAGSGDLVSAGGTISLTAGSGGSTNISGSNITLLGGVGGGTASAGNILLATTRGNVGVGTASPVGALTVMNGNVGVGTWSPTQRLQVVGTVAATAFVGDGSGLTGISAGSTGWTDGGANVYTSTTTDNVGIGTTTPNASTFEIVKNAAQPLLKMSSAAGGNGDYLTVGSSGNFGIGTTTPFYALDIGRSAASMLRARTYSASDNVGFQVESTAQIWSFGMRPGIGAPASNFAIVDDTAGRIDLIIDNNGNVGIGTTTPVAGLALMNGNMGIGTWSPTQRLQVVGTVAATAFVGDGSGLTGISAGSTGWTEGGTNVYTSTTTDMVAIGTTTPASLLTVKGNVGIGTTTPYITIAAPANGMLVEGNVGIGTFASAGGKLIVMGGSVGLGTVAPGEELVVNKSQASGTVISVVNSSGSGGGYAEFNAGTDTGNTRFGIDENSAGGSAYVWNAANTALEFATNNTERMRITNSGSVGLGTTLPAAGLAVMNGNVGIGTWNPANMLSITGSIGLGTTLPYRRIAAPNNGMVVEGNVGIGTWNPMAKLQVVGNGLVSTRLDVGSSASAISNSGALNVLSTGSNTAIGFRNDSVGEAGIVYNSTALGLALETYLAVPVTIRPGNVTTAYFGSDGNLGLGTTAPLGGLVVMSGNVGIGTWSPTQRLQVVGTVSATAFVGDGSGLTGISAGSSGWTDGGTNVFTSTTTDTVGIGTTTAPSRLTIAGNVGIGTTLPYRTIAGPNNGMLVEGNVGIGTWTPHAQLTLVNPTTYVSPQMIIRNGTTSNITSYPSSFTPTLTIQTNETSGSRPLFFGYDNAGSWDSFLTIGACGAFSSMCLDLGQGVNVYTALKNVGSNLYFGGAIAGQGDGSFNDIYFYNTGNIGIGTNTPAGALIVMNGNVGIGTLMPLAKLAVIGTVSATSFTGDGSGLTGISAGGWTDGGTNVYTTATTDNVGIGTTTPVSTLTVVGNIGIGTTTAYKNVAGPRNGIIAEGNVGIGTWRPDAQLEIAKLGLQTPLMVSSTGSGNGDYLIVLSDGRVGIGTTSPGDKIEVVNSFDGQAFFSFANYTAGTSASSGVQVKSSSSTGYLTAASSSYTLQHLADRVGFGSGLDASGLDVYSPGQDIHFLVGDISLASNIRMAIDPAGNVGIGTSTSSNLLGVIGSVGIGTTTPYRRITGPANGLIAEGNVGIGTWAAINGKLVVLGGNVGIGTVNPAGAFTVMNGNVGIGTWSPNNRLSLSGNIGIGTTTPYKSISGPNNGMVLEGNIGIGTWAATEKLLVMGGNVGIGTITPVGAFSVMNGNVGIGTWSPVNTLQIKGSFTTGVVTLTDGATIATDASLGNLFRVTLGGNRTLGNPTNAVDGQKITWELIQDGSGSRTISLDTKFALGSDITAVTLTTTSGKRDFLGAVYNSATDKWYVVSFIKGY